MALTENEKKLATLNGKLTFLDIMFEVDREVNNDGCITNTMVNALAEARQIVSELKGVICDGKK